MIILTHLCSQYWCSRPEWSGHKADAGFGVKGGHGVAITDLSLKAVNKRPTDLKWDLHEW